VIVDFLDQLFEPDCNQQPDDDGGQVNEEFPPAVCAGVRGVDVEHGWHVPGGWLMRARGPLECPNAQVQGYGE
jgi:hypothetical protein